MYYDKSSMGDELKGYVYFLQPGESCPVGNCFIMQKEGRDLTKLRVAARFAYPLLAVIEHDEIFEIQKLESKEEVKAVEYFADNKYNHQKNLSKHLSDSEKRTKLIFKYIKEFFLRSSEKLEMVHVTNSDFLKKERLIPRTYLQRCVSGYGSFRNSENGLSHSLDEVLDELQEKGFLVQIAKNQEHFKQGNKKLVKILNKFFEEFSQDEQ